MGVFSDYKWVPWVLAVYFIVQATIRILISNSVRIDEAQQFLVGQWLAWGYDAQPPLYNWLQYGVFEIFGTSIASLVILKNTLLFLVYLAYHKLARQLLVDRRLAALATLSLLTMPQMFWQAQRDLTHTVGTLLTITLFIYFVVKTVRNPTILSYVMIGLWAGLGMLTKYNFSLIIVSVLVAILCQPGGFKRVVNWRFLLTLSVAALVFLPHALWMISNMDLVLTTTVKTMSEQDQGSKLSDIGHGLIELVTTTVVIIAPTTVIFLVFFRQSFLRALRAKSQWSDFFSRIFLSTVAILLILMVFATLTEFRDRWLLPLLFLVPLYFCLKLEAAGEAKPEEVRKFFVLTFVMMIALPIIIAAGVMLPRVFNSYEHLNTPYASFVNKVISEEGKLPRAVVTTTWLKAGNIRVNMPHTAVISAEYPKSDLTREAIGNGPVLLVWNERDGHQSTMPHTLQDWLTTKYGPSVVLPSQNDVALPYYYGRKADRYHFGYAWFVPPAQ